MLKHFDRQFDSFVHGKPWEKIACCLRSSILRFNMYIGALWLLIADIIQISVYNVVSASMCCCVYLGNDCKGILAKL